jgi:starch synthase
VLSRPIRNDPRPLELKHVASAEAPESTCHDADCEHDEAVQVGVGKAQGRRIDAEGARASVAARSGLAYENYAKPSPVVDRTGLPFAHIVVVGQSLSSIARLYGLSRYNVLYEVAYKRGFSEPMAHLIEAGSDMFLMPSRYEPCGLNQMYSLRYGTPPIVHRTGGLADTVTPFDASRRTGNGFVFDHFDEGGLTFGLLQALKIWGSGEGDDRERWIALQRNGMRAKLGWDERVTAYEMIYWMIAPGRERPDGLEAAPGLTLRTLAIVRRSEA